MGNKLSSTYDLRRRINYHESLATRKIRAIPYTKPKEKDYEFLASQSGIGIADLRELFDSFLLTHPDGKLNRKEFADLYHKLRTQSADQIDRLTQSVFKALSMGDTITLNELFMVFALHSPTDLATKLDYTFDLYDTSNVSALEQQEANEIVSGIVELLGSGLNVRERARFVRECCNGMKTTRFVTKGK